MGNKGKKQAIIGNLRAIRRKIFALVCQLPPEKCAEVFLGEWTVLDLLAHLEGWDHWNLKGAKEVISGKLPAYFSFYDPDWRRFNAALVNKYKKKNVNEQLASLQQSHQRLINFLERISNEEFIKDHRLRWQSWEITIAGDLQTELDDEETHYRQLKKWITNQK
jgi:hypothetical protein